MSLQETILKANYQAYFDAGLTPAGVNEEGEQEWIGTREQWQTLENYLELEARV